MCTGAPPQQQYRAASMMAMMIGASQGNPAAQGGLQAMRANFQNNHGGMTAAQLMSVRRQQQPVVQPPLGR